ncbi:hypothetical protein FACS189463_0570 [Bacteroidia bacterium]|nr:hypothetical protein FACS189463_0570 [Bacteroidia bacterium]
MGKCDDYTLIALSVMRAKGIPVLKDFIPQWPFRSSGHSWCVLLCNSGKNIIFDGASPGGINFHIDDPMGKVFRECYAINKDIIQLHKAEKHIPYHLRSRFIKDVTDEYQKTSDIKIKLESVLGKYAYLSVFDNATWVPVKNKH